MGPAGLPKKVVPSGTGFTTTAPIPTRLFAPIRSFCKTVLFGPSQAPRPIRTLPLSATDVVRMAPRSI